MKTKLVIILLFLAIMSPAQEKKLFWDGYDWQKIDKITAAYPEYAFWIKSAYLNGLFDGKSFYRFNLSRTPCAPCDSLFADWLKPTKNRRMIAGLDMFYQDASNRYIPLPLAAMATVMIQLGRPRSEIDQFIRESKQWINELTIEIYESQE